MTLSEFTGYTSGGGSGVALELKGPTPNEMLCSPMGPKERSTEEMRFNQLGGEFSSYRHSGGSSMGRSRIANKRRIESVVVLLELLQQLKSSDFIDQQEYEE
ncbi:hypothetical protein PIB30_042331 [Stylosanthes scabra]|uniref:Uncharacterized protein n=1 Tax=Stylosanthes scabra TaxID=79078 RepID=A0ABU6RFW7_9FABA|nr:hypothetical protein [Stylosanthes scabra]